MLTHNQRLHSLSYRQLRRFGDEFMNPKTSFSNENCGCFHCLKTFRGDRVKEWIDQKKETALCPHCNTDAVLAESEVRATGDRRAFKEVLDDLYADYFEISFRY